MRQTFERRKCDLCGDEEDAVVETTFGGSAFAKWLHLEFYDYGDAAFVKKDFCSEKCCVAYLSPAVKDKSAPASKKTVPYLTEEQRQMVEMLSEKKGPQVPWNIMGPNGGTVPQNIVGAK